MNNNHKFLLTLLFTIFPIAATIAQKPKQINKSKLVAAKAIVAQTITTGDYRTTGNATFSSPANWQTYDGSNWVNATVAPANTATPVATATVDTQFIVKTTIGSVVATIPNVTTTVSTTITVPSTALLAKGQYVSGPFIPSGATVASITNATQFVLSANAQAGTGTLTFSVPNSITGVTWTANTNTITFNAANLTGAPVVGQPITGPNIPASSYIYAVSLNGANSTLQIATSTSAPAAITIPRASTNVTLSFGAQLVGNNIIEIQTPPSPIYVGMPLNGFGLGGGSYYITATNVNGNPNCIQMSTVSGSSRLSSFIVMGGLQLSTSTYLGAINSGTISIGNLVIGAGIPAGTMVTSVSGNRITFSQPATAQAFSIIPPTTLSFYAAGNTITNVFINHNTVVDASNTAMIENLFVNDATGSNAGTGAAYSNATLKIGNNSTQRSLLLGSLQVATNASIVIGAFNAKHSMAFNARGNAINNNGAISFYNSAAQYCSLVFMALNDTSSIIGNGTNKFNDITILSGTTLVAPSAMTLCSNFINNGIFSHNNGTITCAGGTTTVSGIPTTFNAITINAGATFNSIVNTNIIGNVVNNGGTFSNTNFSTITFSGATSITSNAGSPTISFYSVSITGTLVAYSGAMSVGASFTNNGTFVHNNGTVNFNSTSGINIAGAGFSTTKSPFYNVNFTSTNTNTLVSSVAIANNLTIGTNATLVIGDTLKIGGNLTNSGTFNATGGVIEFSGNTAIVSPSIALNSVLIDSGAMFSVPTGANISVIGDWTNLGGTFNANQSTVILSPSSSQTITGANTFYNLQKQATAACALTLGAGMGNAQSITGMLTIGGSSIASVLTIASSTQGAQAFLVPAAVSPVGYVIVSDNNISIATTANQSSNVGNNTNWVFTGNIATHGSSIYSPQDPLSLQTPIETAFKHDRSPLNQVFQWKIVEDSNQTAYLWVPENCKRVRGVLVLGWNVPEHMLVGHSAIRKACIDNGIGIMLSSDFYYGLHSDKERIACFLRQLKRLADTSGYPEITTIPILPIGESAHLNNVTLLQDSLPLRCIAAACLKNASFPKTKLGKLVPMINSAGTAYEWGQTDTATDPRTFWNTGFLNYYRNCVSGSRGASVLIEAGTGHFECSERMTQFLARYIGLAAKARIAADTNQTLIPVDLNSGYVADVPVVGITDLSIIPYTKATPTQQTAKPWYFDSLSAKEAQAIGNVNWNAQTQIPTVLAGDNDTVMPWGNNGVTNVNVVSNGDFSLNPYLLDTIPSAFKRPGVAGAPLAKSPGKPYIDWICGNMQPLGNNRFRIIGSRYTGLSVLMAKADSSLGIRYSNQPLTINLVANNTGTAQTITFNPIGNQKDTIKSLPLVAKSNKGQPVSFYVESGPAVVINNQLVFTKIPPNAKYPVAVNVVAWQWGTCTPPLYKQATVKQSFYLTK